MLKIGSSEHMELEGTGGRFIHVATVHNTTNFKEYILMYDTVTHKKYIEEITGGSLRAIEDDNEWEDLSNFAQHHDLFPTFIKK